MVTTGCGIDRKKHLTGSKVSGSGHLLTQKIQERVRDSESLLSPEWRNSRSLTTGAQSWLGALVTQCEDWTRETLKEGVSRTGGGG